MLQITVYYYATFLFLSAVLRTGSLLLGTQHTTAVSEVFLPPRMMLVTYQVNPPSTTTDQNNTHLKFKLCPSLNSRCYFAIPAGKTNSGKILSLLVFRELLAPVQTDSLLCRRRSIDWLSPLLSSAEIKLLQWCCRLFYRRPFLTNWLMLALLFSPPGGFKHASYYTSHAGAII